MYSSFLQGKTHSHRIQRALTLPPVSDADQLHVSNADEGCSFYVWVKVYGRLQVYVHAPLRVCVCVAACMFHRISSLFFFTAQRKEIQYS